MTTPLAARLSLETVEDRLTPARFGPEMGHHGERPDVRDFDDSRPFSRHDASDRSNRQGRPFDRIEFREELDIHDHDEQRFEHRGSFHERVIREPWFLHIAMMAARQAQADAQNDSLPARQSDQRIANPPVAQVSDEGPVSSKILGETNAVFIGVDDEAVVGVALAGDAPHAASFIAASIPVVATPPSGTTGANWSVPFTGVGLDVADDSPLPEVADVVAAPPKGEVVAPPTLGERIRDAIFSDGVPLPGVVPLIETSAERVLSQLDELWADVAGDGLDWEQTAWLAGAVLVLGGATYAVRANAPRRKLDAYTAGSRSTRIIWEG